MISDEKQIRDIVFEVLEKLDKKNNAAREPVLSYKSKFSRWLRDQSALSPSLGYVCTDIDFLWKNYKTKHWCFIEEKTLNGRPQGSNEMPTFQRIAFNQLDKICRPDKWYQGFHTIELENTSPLDGLVYLDGEQIDVDELVEWLGFNSVVDKYLKYKIR